MIKWRIILFLLTALLSPLSHAALGDILGVNPLLPTVTFAPNEPTTTPIIDQSTNASVTDSTLTTSTRTAPFKNPTSVRGNGEGGKAQNPKVEPAEREMANRANSNVIIGGVMILLVGLLGPLVLYFWIRKRRQQEEAEFAAYLAASPPYSSSTSPQTGNYRRQAVEMRSVPVNRPVSPSGVPPPPTYQEALASGRIPEQPK